MFEGKENSLEEKENLNIALENVSESLKREGVQVDNKCRLVQDAYVKAGVFAKQESEEDLNYIKERKTSNLYGRVDKDYSEGEKLEQLKTIIFHKNLGDTFIVARSTEYDDMKNSVDNVIVHRTTGTPLCAFDEIADTGAKMADKRAKISKINKKSGARLKYGLSIDREDDGVKLTGDVEELPLFYLAVSNRALHDTIRTIDTNLDSQSDNERRMFQHFMIMMYEQVIASRKYVSNKTIRNRMNNIKTFLEDDLNVRDMLIEYVRDDPGLLKLFSSK